MASGPISSTVEATFMHFDKDNSGTLEKRELSSALRHLGIECTTGGVIKRLSKYDTNETGRLDIHQFNLMVTDIQQERAEQRDKPIRLGSCYSASPSIGIGATLAPSEATFKPEEISKEMQKPEIVAVFQQHRVAISELYEHYSRLQVLVKPA